MTLLLWEVRHLGAVEFPTLAPLNIIPTHVLHNSNLLDLCEAYMEGQFQIFAVRDTTPAVPTSSMALFLQHMVVP